MKDLIKSTKQKLRLPARASLWYIGASAIAKAIGILATPIFTRLLTGEEYGAYALYMSYLGIGSLICSPLSSGAVIYKGLDKYKNDGSFLTSVFWTNSVICALICILLFAFGRLDASFLPFLFIQLLCDIVIGIYGTKCRFNYDYIKAAGVSVLVALSAPIISILLIKGIDIGFRGRIYGLLIASTVMAVPLFYTILRDSGKIYDRDAGKYLLTHAIPLLPHAVAGAAVSQADKLILCGFLGTAALARYSVVHSVGVGLIFAVTAISSALNPWIMRKLSQKKEHTVSELVRLLTFMFSAAVLLLIALTPEIMRFLAPAEYMAAIGAVLPIALSTLPSFAASVCTTGLVFSDKSGSASVSSLISAGVNITANFLLIRYFAYTGAGIALMLANLTSFFVSYLYLLKSRHADIIPLKSIFYGFTITSFWGIFIALLYDYAWARMLLMIPPAVIGLGALLESRRYIFEKKG